MTSAVVRASGAKTGREPRKPQFLKGHASRLWDEYAPICAAMGTVTAADSHEFATWCCLAAEYEEGPKRMIAARVAQKRAYAERFGLGGAGARSKLTVKDANESQDPADKYFSNFGVN